MSNDKEQMHIVVKVEDGKALRVHGGWDADLAVVVVDWDRLSSLAFFDPSYVEEVRRDLDRVASLDQSLFKKCRAISHRLGVLLSAARGLDEQGLSVSPEVIKAIRVNQCS